MAGWGHLSPAQVADATRAGGLAKAAAERARGAELVARYNLAGLTPKEAQLCLLLVGAGRPLTCREWLSAAGVRESKAPTRLLRAGLVAMSQSPRRGSRGRGPVSYLPTLRLLDLLAAAASRPSPGSS